MIQNLPWLFLLLPLAVAAINWLCFRKCACCAATLSILSALGTFGLCVAYLSGALPAATPDIYTWMPISTEGMPSLSLGLLMDPLAMRMMLVVTGIGLLVHIFSIGYMKGDPSNKSRYFAGLSIFMFSMTMIVMADNLAMTFIGWEMVGFSSYLLIGHWFNKESAADAAKKAFITNRVGDFGFLIGILLTMAVFGTLTFSEMSAATAGIPAAVLTATVLCLFCGAVGKSAQFPLHVWLPDAMEGPTPVSALIHAATMVAAGVYMLVRLQVSMGEAAFTDTACTVIASVGAITAVLAALMAVQQDDIKRVLAYSTLSQLGYMVMAVGLLAGEAAMFHLYTHAWFKALLFLGAGAIIVGCHHEQDIWKMGGLAKKMPITTVCFLMGTFALIAIPGFSGFFSKELILDAALAKSPVFFWVGAGVAALTTFYMARLCLVAFLGNARAHGAEHATEKSFTMSLPLIILAIMAVISGYGFVADSLVPFEGFHAHGFEPGLPFYVSMGSLVLGLALAWLVYGCGKRSTDPMAGNALSTALRERMYIDKFYDKGLIGLVQDCGTRILEFIDTTLIRGICVQGTSWLIGRFGILLSWIQGGSLRAYSLVIGLGVLFIMFILAFTFHSL
ncbi:MAG: NADH-quinone oxidoreductase subunit L [Akkermansiaceae bacterium]|nr:NADH-quinone oxidoreductase subunit L [Akkermansiaceae bacterium]